MEFKVNDELLVKVKAPLYPEISEVPDPSVTSAILSPVPGSVIVILSPSKVAATVSPFGVRSPDLTFAPATA